MCGNTLKANKSQSNPMVTCIAPQPNGRLVSSNHVNISMNVKTPMILKSCKYCQGKGVDGIGAKCNVCYFVHFVS